MSRALWAGKRNGDTTKIKSYKLQRRYAVGQRNVCRAVGKKMLRNGTRPEILRRDSEEMGNIYGTEVRATWRKEERREERTVERVERASLEIQKAVRSCQTR